MFTESPSAAEVDNDDDKDSPKSNVHQFPFAERQALAKWWTLAEHLEENYHEPDLEALRIVMAAGIAHHLWPQARPVWLMVIGPAGTGKSAVVMSVLAGTPQFYALSNLTPQTFLSGWSKGGGKGASKKDPSLLNKVGSSVIFGISDFSSISSMREDNRAQIASQLREIFDGTISKDFGVGDGIHRAWSGKATCIVGCTKNVERMWATQRELGERFLYLRWRTGDAEELALKAGVQDFEVSVKQITTGYAKDLINAALDREAPKATSKEMKALGLQKVAALVARLRCAVVKGPRDNEVIDVADPEGPGRIMQTIYQVMRAHATMFARSEVTSEDYKAGLRVAKDSIPLLRLKILEASLSLPADGFTRDQLDKALKEMGWRLPASTMHGYLIEMIAVGAISETQSAAVRWYRIEDDTREKFEFLQKGLTAETLVDDTKDNDKTKEVDKDDEMVI